MNAKERAAEIYAQHLTLASADGRSFRKTVMDQLMAETGCTLAAAATHYNTAKKNSTPVEGLGRAPVPKGIRKPGKNKATNPETPDDECFTVLELVRSETNLVVGRCQSFLLQGDASEKFDEKTEAWPNVTWVMIQGLGPNSGDNFKLGAGEREIKRYEVLA